MALPSLKKNFDLQALFGVLLLASAMWIVLFNGPEGIDRNNIEQRLQQFAGYVAREAAGENREGRFTYGDIEIEGWGFDKRATVRNVSILFSKKDELHTARLLFVTAKMDITADPARPGHLLFVFPEPVNVIEGSQLKAKITFPSPVTYGYFDGRENNVHSITHTLYLPNQIVMTPAKAMGTPGSQGGRVILSYDENPLLRLKLLPGSGEREAVYEFHNVRISAPDDNTEAVIASLASRITEKPGADNRPQGKYTLMMVDFAVHDQDRTTKAYTVSADIDYSGDVPAMMLVNPAPGGGNTDMTLNQVVIASDDFKLKADGTLSTASDDPLPSGNLNVAIDNVKQFLLSDLVPEPARPALINALQKATGQPADTLTQAAIPIRREKNGVLYVGNVTFEELAASMLASMIKAAPPVPPLPENAVPASGPPDATPQPPEND